MHIELQSVDKIFMFVNICYVTSLEKIDLIDDVKNIILKYRVKLKLKGFYKVKVFVNELVGLFIELCKIDELEYSNTLDLRILVFYDEDVYFETDDYFVLDGCGEIMFYNNKFYCNVRDVSILRMVEFGNFIFGDEVLKMLSNSVVV